MSLYSGFIIVFFYNNLKQYLSQGKILIFCLSTWLQDYEETYLARDIFKFQTECKKFRWEALST